jgi:hypothetical protein
MQGSLIDHRTGEQHLAVILSSTGQALKPGCPLATQITFDSDLLDHGLLYF